jgi:hypothetical protein
MEYGGWKRGGERRKRSKIAGRYPRFIIACLARVTVNAFYTNLTSTGP